jgi:predicted dienelactone hydrolase
MLFPGSARKNTAFPLPTPRMSWPTPLNPSAKGPGTARPRWRWLLALFLTWSAAIADPVNVVEDLVLNDAARDRQVPLKIYYPQQERPGGYPVVIFSHGSGGSKDGYEYLGRFWAENGYVVIHVTHIEVGLSIVTINSGANSPAAVKAAKEDPVINRPQDISFIIDSLPSIARARPDLGDRMDSTRIGVAGHSFGAYTAMAVAGAVIHLPRGETRTFGDPRVKAFIALSPQGPGINGFAIDSWAPITRPMLTISGTEDRIGVRNGDPAEHLQPFKHMPPAGKFQVTVPGVTHNGFGDSRLDGTPSHEFIKRVGLAFWDTALRENDPSATNFQRALAEKGISDNGGGNLAGVGAMAELKSK